MLTLNEGLTIAAVLLSPMIAVQVQKYLERKRDIRERKLSVFHTLMATRASRLSPIYVEALNRIDLTFTDAREKPIRDKWKECLDKFANVPKPPEQPAAAAVDVQTPPAQPSLEGYHSEMKVWNDAIEDLTADLLYEMGKSLGYDFDKIHIKRGAYIPKAHADTEVEQNLLRRGLVELLVFRKPLPLEVHSMPSEGEQVSKEQEEIRKLLSAYLKGEQTMPVRVTKEE